jgi:hypothetical protein
MDKSKLIDLYSKRGASDKQAQQAIDCVLSLERHLVAKGTELDTCSVEDVKSYIASLLAKGEIKSETLLAMARYFYLENRHDIYIYFTKLFGGMGVLENIKRRAEKYAGEETAQKIFDGFTLPPLGTAIEEVPKYTNDLMARLKKHTSPDLYKKILAGNNHGVPEQSMQSEKELYEKSESLAQYLKERHERKVAELQQYCDTGQIWYEQEITQPVVDFVASNQEILSAVEKDGKLYVTKIPYDPAAYLTAKTDKEKNYYACHCTFAREAIMSGHDAVNSDWCYCSAGFGKFPFEVILGRELDVKVINSALDGDGFCRFEIDLGESKS